MTLHEAIRQVLLQDIKPLTAIQISERLNANSWYSKKDGSLIKSSQIAARVKNYPYLFTKSDGLISLNSSAGIARIKEVPLEKKVILNSSFKDDSLLKKVLMNEKNFKSVMDSEYKIPDQPGLYCVRIKNSKAIPSIFQQVLIERNHNIIYIGLASKSLRQRFWSQELRAKGHGTFFRSLGAVLGYQPEFGSLKGKQNQNNYKFSKHDETKIIDWINENLIINWVTVANDLNGIENQLIKTYFPLLNLAGNPLALNDIRLLRDKCKMVARGVLAK